MEEKYDNEKLLREKADNDLQWYLSKKPLIRQLLNSTNLKISESGALENFQQENPGRRTMII